MTRKKILLPLLGLLTSLLATRQAYTQTIMPLYPGAIPNAKPHPDEEQSETSKEGILIIRKISRPTLTVYLPSKEKATGTAVIICPGGGYWVTASGHEGADVAKRFNEMGVAAFVLKYRIPDTATMIDKETGPLQDAQRAIQLVRENAGKWGVRPNRIGIMGFSAGGHLASTAGTHYRKAYIDNANGTSLRPDFMVLVYPVVSFTDSVGHTGSRDQLIGKQPAPEKIREYSNEQHVDAKTPPTYLVHAKDDGVKVANSLVFAQALQKHGIAHGMHLYEKGGHGYGMYNKASDVLWMDLVAAWLKEMNLLGATN